jgi:hypothetical protein
MNDPRDRRVAERYPVTTETACTFLSPVVEDFGPGRIENVSMHGIGLQTAKSVQVGSLLAVSLSNSARGFAKTVLVRVAHTTTRPGGFLIGGTFTTPLSYDEMTKLVM